MQIERIITAKTAQAIDKYTIYKIGIPGTVLMETAGKSIADYVIDKFTVEKDNVMILVGSGNNGGDGLVTARLLKIAGYTVTVIMLNNPENLKGDPLIQYELLNKLDDTNVIVRPEIEMFITLLNKHNIVIDAIFGTGLNKSVKGYYYDIIESTTGYDGTIISVDIPSGINADSGIVEGTAIHADVTITFNHLKLGHILKPGKIFSGNVIKTYISLFPEDIIEGSADDIFYINQKFYDYHISERKYNEHKYSIGTVGIICGSEKYPGAAVLSANAALKSGAGMVFLYVPKKIINRLYNIRNEIIVVPYTEKTKDFSKLLHNKIDTIVIGCGLDINKVSEKITADIIKNFKGRIVVDGDAITILFKSKLLKSLTKADKRKLVFTPHHGEFNKISGISKREVNENIFSALKDYIIHNHINVVLKGPDTIIGTITGQYYIVNIGTPKMAVAGMGDTLAGIIGAFITQFTFPYSIPLAVYYHSKRALDIINKSDEIINVLPSDI